MTQSPLAAPAPLAASLSLPHREAIALARKAPLSRSAVRDLAKRLGPELTCAAAVEALDTAGANAAMVLAFAAAAAGARLPADLVRALLPEVSSLDHVGALVHAAEGSPLDLLTAFLADERGDLELECLALLLASDALGSAEALGPAAPALPTVMLTRGRWLARHQLSGDASLYLGAAAARIKDPDLSALAAPHVNRARRAKKAIEEALDTAKLPPLEALDDAEGTRVSTGFTVRHTSPSVGRNDPCPCGSGKKYKKCHALSDETPVASEPPTLDAATLGPDQVALLRPSEIAALDTARLSPKAFVEAFRRVVDFRRWDLALVMIAQGKERRDLGKGEDEGFVLDALRGAYDARARVAAERLHALLPPDLADREVFALECLRAPADLLARIEREAEAALRTDADGARGMLLASALLRWFPALGIYVARGALHEGRTRDSQALLQQIEDARDRLLLSPFEAWWDVYDAFFESADERREQKRDDARREKMKEDLRRARAMSRKARAELEKLQERVAELDASLTPSKRAPTSTSASAPKEAALGPEPSPDLGEERRRLKSKIEELQRIIGAGQEERRELRRQLADREEDEAQASTRPQKGDTRSDDPDHEPEGLHDAGAIDLPRGILVPRFSERASKALAELAADAADGVLGLVAGLAAGKPNAWGGVKQLTKVRGVLSARAGIHHRVLFATQERALEVLEVIHRRDLEQTVARLARGS